MHPRISWLSNLKSCPRAVPRTGILGLLHLLSLKDGCDRAQTKEMERKVEFEKKLEVIFIKLVFEDFDLTFFDIILAYFSLSNFKSLRKNVEDSLYSKPVCFKVEYCGFLLYMTYFHQCIELCNELETFPTLLASNIFEELDNQTSYANLKLMVKTLTLATIHADPGGQTTVEANEGEGRFVARWRRPGPVRNTESRKNKITIARGGTYGEPLELARYCGGKIPASEDETQSEIFCDVRFDRSRKQVKGIERVFFKESRKYRCMGTGKVFCETCIKFRAAVPEFSEKPECAEVFPVCLEVRSLWLSYPPCMPPSSFLLSPENDLQEWRRRSVEGNSKILSVTEQKPTGGGVWNIFPQSGRRVGILMQVRSPLSLALCALLTCRTQQANEEEEDEESPLIEAVRRMGGRSFQVDERAVGTLSGSCRNVAMAQHCKIGAMNVAAILVLHRLRFCSSAIRVDFYHWSSLLRDTSQRCGTSQISPCRGMNVDNAINTR
eukprot:271202-Hanusia_phi.AAC.2